MIHLPQPIIGGGWHGSCAAEDSVEAVHCIPKGGGDSEIAADYFYSGID